MINVRDEKGKAYSPVYLKTLHNQLSAVFNHAVKYYGLYENPASKVRNMGKSKNREMPFWTQEEYTRFADEMMDKPRPTTPLKCCTGAVSGRENFWR